MRASVIEINLPFEEDVEEEMFVYEIIRPAFPSEVLFIRPFHNYQPPKYDIFGIEEHELRIINEAHSRVGVAVSELAEKTASIYEVADIFIQQLDEEEKGYPYGVVYRLKVVKDELSGKLEMRCYNLAKVLLRGEEFDLQEYGLKYRGKSSAKDVADCLSAARKDAPEGTEGLLALYLKPYMTLAEGKPKQLIKSKKLQFRKREE